MVDKKKMCKEVTKISARIYEFFEFDKMEFLEGANIIKILTLRLFLEAGRESDDLNSFLKSVHKDFKIFSKKYQKHLKQQSCK